MRKPQNIVGLAAIDKAIKGIDNVAGNLADRVQDVAVAIVEHGANAGNGDMSRALTLCKTISRRRILNVAFLIGWFRAFGNCTVNLRANDGAGKVSLHARDSKAFATYGGFNVDGAKVNRWTDAFNDDGTRAAWYEGPAPAEFTPMGIGDVAQDFRNFVEREAKKLDGTKQVGDKVVPLYNLTDAERTQVLNGLDLLARLSATLGRKDEIRRLEEEKAKVEAVQDEEVNAILEREPKEKAVA